MSSKKSDSENPSLDEVIERDFSNDGSGVEEIEDTSIDSSNTEAQNSKKTKSDKTDPDDNSPSAQLAAKDAEITKAKNDLLYLKAEFDNFRKRSIKERSDLAKYGVEKVVVEFLNVLDIIDRALQTEPTPENIDSFHQGVVMTRKEFVNSLKKFGIEEIESQGQPFDPTLHEALSSCESESVPAGHVLDIYRKGYKLHDKLIRAAQVIVAKETEETSNKKESSPK